MAHQEARPPYPPLYPPTQAPTEVAMASVGSLIREVLCCRKENSSPGPGRSGAGLLQFLEAQEHGRWGSDVPMAAAGNTKLGGLGDIASPSQLPLWSWGKPNALCGRYQWQVPRCDLCCRYARCHQGGGAPPCTLPCIALGFTIVSNKKKCF